VPRHQFLNPKNKFVIAFSLLAIALVTKKVFAFEATTETGPSAPCAMVENYGGDVEILDPSRTHMTTVVGKNVGIPCGGWVSSQSGWAIIRHRDGHDLRVGPKTFVEIPENSASSPDQVVLYHGEMFGSTEGGGGDLQILTANARVRVPRGNVLVNYDPETQDTQLVALDNPATLENRFEPKQKVQVKPGEATSLDFKLLRVTPTFPKAISVAALREKLALFHVNDKDATQAYEVAQMRAERRMAATLTPEDDLKKDEAKPSDKQDKNKDDDLTFATRKIASDPASYENNSHSEEDAMLKSHMVRKMTAGEDVGERILYPDKFHGKPRRINLVIDDPGAAMDKNSKKVEDTEKKKLIEELSQIHED
jgi:hypothetical protein